jgi:hypothetical protein
VRGQTEKYRQHFASLVLLLAFAKFALQSGWIDLPEAVHQAFGSARLVREVLAPASRPWWLIALIFDALVTYGLLFLADAALARIDVRGRRYKRLVTHVVAMVTYARATFAVAAITYLVAVGVTQVVQHGA